MAKLSGLGISGITIGDAAGTPRDLTNDILDFALDRPMATMDDTGVDKFAHERLPGLTDAKITLTIAYNPSANHAHAVLSGDPTVARVVVIPFPAGDGSGTTATATYLITDYSLTRGNTGQLQGKATLEIESGAVVWS